MREDSGGLLVIFDCDGVLVDSEPTSNRVFAEELRRAGVDWSVGQVAQRLTGRSDRSCIELVERETGCRLPDDFLDRIRRRTFEALRRGLRPVPGVRRALDRIRLPRCVASSSDHDRIRLSLRLAGLLDRFDGRIYSSSDVARGKPFPDLFLHSAREMGVEPARAIVVEDSLPGVLAARSAGMRVLAYVSHGDGRLHREAGARVFSEMDRLPRLIEGLE